MSHGYTKAIINGMIRYMRMLGAAPNMLLHTGDVEWINPHDGFKGPSLVYSIMLNPETAGTQIDSLVEDIGNERMPSVWFIPPDSTPPNIVELLKDKGFREISDPERPEYGMAVELEFAPVWPETPEGVSIKHIDRFEDFELWVEIVNDALHGWPMIDAQGYRHLLEAGDVMLYIGYVDGNPATTAATIKSGQTATLEFVSTLPGYRNRGAATAACVRALNDLAGVKLVTLRAEYDALGLYKRLGFIAYFKTTVMKL